MSQDVSVLEIQGVLSLWVMFLLKCFSINFANVVFRKGYANMNCVNEHAWDNVKESFYVIYT